MIIGFRFLIGGLISIVLAFITKYFVFISAYIKYISNQIHYKRNPKENKYKDWYKPWLFIASKGGFSCTYL